MIYTGLISSQFSWYVGTIQMLWNLAGAEFWLVQFFLLSSLSLHPCFSSLSNFIHFIIKSFLNSSIFDFFPYFFLFSLWFSFHFPFSPTMYSSGCSSISSPHDPMLCCDEPMKISNKEEYDETSYPVLSERHVQAPDIQPLDMADYTLEVVSINLSQIFDL